MSFEEKLKLINSLDVLIKRQTKGSAFFMPASSASRGVGFLGYWNL
jgi:hypothetical protein